MKAISFATVALAVVAFAPPSGAQVQDQRVLTLAGATPVAAARADSADLAWIDAADVAAAFAKGSPLVETDAYAVHASRREAAGHAEVHERDTDVIHVLEGSATFVTGGRIVEPTTVAPDEVRGPSIEGGAVRTLAKGDVVVVPNGTPHWFRDVSGPVLYYVVKVTAPAASR